MHRLKKIRHKKSKDPTAEKLDRDLKAAARFSKQIHDIADKTIHLNVLNDLSDIEEKARSLGYNSRADEASTLLEKENARLEIVKRCDDFNRLVLLQEYVVDIVAPGDLKEKKELMGLLGRMVGFAEGYEFPEQAERARRRLEGMEQDEKDSTNS
ncbi:MAG: hypothetical protein Q9159_002400 [Coniocarpon cinnabarinum]